MALGILLSSRLLDYSVRDMQVCSSTVLFLWELVGLRRSLLRRSVGDQIQIENLQNYCTCIVQTHGIQRMGMLEGLIEGHILADDSF